VYDCIINPMKCKEPTSCVVDTLFSFVQYFLSAKCGAVVLCCHYSFTIGLLCFSHTFCVLCILFSVCMCLFVSSN